MSNMLIRTATVGDLKTYTAGGLTIAVSETMAYPLTPCCEASATGTMDGIACRSCCELIDDAYGDCASIEDDADLTRFLSSAISMFSTVKPDRFDTALNSMVMAIKSSPTIYR